MKRSHLGYDATAGPGKTTLVRSLLVDRDLLGGDSRVVGQGKDGEHDEARD